jgi:hypothetical protein
MNKGFAFAVVERSVLSKLRAEKLRAWKVDDLCDRFNVTAVRRRRGLIPKVGDPMDTGRSLEESGRPHSARSGRWSEAAFGPRRCMGRDCVVLESPAHWRPPAHDPRRAAAV